MDRNQKEKLLKKMKSHRYSRTEITNKKIADLQAKMDWQGTGTEYDPIIINDLSGLKPNLWIHRSSLCYIIRDVIIYKLMCTSTQNITIENCKINELEVEGCYNMAIRNSSILWLKFVYSRGCVLENNSFSSEAFEKLESNYFDRIYSIMQKGLYFPAALSLFIAFLIFTFSIYVWYLGLLTLGLVALIFYYVHTLKVKKKRTNEKPDNIFAGNSLLKTDDREEILNEILGNYAHLRINWFKGYIHIYIGVSFGVVFGLILFIIIYC